MINILEKINASKYNGGWTKTITGLDKTKNNGYSLKGEFVTVHKGLNQLPDGLYLDNGKDGSRKNQTNNYTLFYIKGDEIEIIKKIEDGGRDWALRLWDSIGEYFDRGEESLLVKFSDEEIIEEITKRGFNVVIQK